MMIIGCDFHPSWRQIAWLDMETGETGEQKLVHVSGDAKMFHQQRAAPALVGMEATGNSQWFIELVQDLGHEIWIGGCGADPGQLRAQTENRQTRCGPHSEVGGGRSFPASLDCGPGASTTSPVDVLPPLAAPPDLTSRSAGSTSPAVRVSLLAGKPPTGAKEVHAATSVPPGPHSLALRCIPRFRERCCSSFFTRLRISTSLCRCSTSCRRSRCAAGLRRRGMPQRLPADP